MDQRPASPEQWRSRVKCMRRGSRVLAAGDVGGVVGPVSAGGALPCDGDFDADSEHTGQHRGREFAGEGEQRGGAVLLRIEADVLQTLAEPFVADRPARVPAGEQPRGVIGGAGHGMAAAGADQPAHHCSQWFREVDRGGAQRDLDPVFVKADVVDGEVGDGGDALGVKKK